MPRNLPLFVGFVGDWGKNTKSFIDEIVDIAACNINPDKTLLTY